MGNAVWWRRVCDCGAELSCRDRRTDYPRYLPYSTALCTYGRMNYKPPQTESEVQTEDEYIHYAYVLYDKRRLIADDYSPIKFLQVMSTSLTQHLSDSHPGGDGILPPPDPRPQTPHTTPPPPPPTTPPFLPHLFFLDSAVLSGSSQNATIRYAARTRFATTAAVTPA